MVGEQQERSEGERKTDVKKITGSRGEGKEEEGIERRQRRGEERGWRGCVSFNGNKEHQIAETQFSYQARDNHEITLLSFTDELTHVARTRTSGD